MTEVTYFQSDHPDLSSALTSTFTRALSGDLLLLSGDCPRCRHPFTTELPIKSTKLVPGRALTGMSAGSVTANPVEHVVACACNFQHEGQPDGAIGCGALAKIVIKARP